MKLIKMEIFFLQADNDIVVIVSSNAWKSSNGPNVQLFTLSDENQELYMDLKHIVMKNETY